MVISQMAEEEEVHELQHVMVDNLEWRNGFDFVYSLRDQNLKGAVPHGGGVTIPKTVFGILKSEFSWSKINYVSFELPSRCVIIGLSAFWHSDLQSICIPASVKILDRLCFSDCHSLKTVAFERSSQLHEIRDEAFAGSSIIHISIPSSVAALGKSCFTRCKDLRKFVIEGPMSNMRILREWTFGFNEMRKIKIPRSIEAIQDSCFYYCDKLDEVTFEDASSLRKIGSRAFMQCALTAVKLPGSVIEIGALCFAYCPRLYLVTFDEEGYDQVVRRITSDAFKGTMYETEIAEIAESGDPCSRTVSGNPSCVEN